VNFQGSQDSAVLAMQLEDMEAVEDLSGSDYGSDITGSEYFCRLLFFFSQENKMYLNLLYFLPEFLTCLKNCESVYY